jgi:ABC-type transporter Mla subunit MlaD
MADADQAPGNQSAGEPGQDLFETFRRLTANMAKATRALLGPASVVGEPAATFATQLAELHRASVQPLRAVVEEQRELAENIAAGLQQLQALTEQFAQWADQHRRLVTQSQALLDPLTEQTEKLASVAEAWAEGFRQEP